jgi:hypothetical protein
MSLSVKLIRTLQSLLTFKTSKVQNFMDSIIIILFLLSLSPPVLLISQITLKVQSIPAHLQTILQGKKKISSNNSSLAFTKASKKDFQSKQS